MWNWVKYYEYYIVEWVIYFCLILFGDWMVCVKSKNEFMISKNFRSFYC